MHCGSGISSDLPKSSLRSPIGGTDELLVAEGRANRGRERLDADVRARVRCVDHHRLAILGPDIEPDVLPAIARRAITAYTVPGDLVLDPMCGIGTTLVEAVHLDRAALGVEYEPRWADVARANLQLAEEQGAAGAGHVVTGDARHLTDLVDADVRGRVALVLTSPPYGASLHGQVTARPGAGVAKSDYRYSRDRANLAHLGHDALLGGLTEILTAAAALLRPGGVVAMTVRPYRHRGALVDLPAAVLRAGETAGLVPYERNVALLVGLRDDRLIPRASFFQLERSAAPAAAATHSR